MPIPEYKNEEHSSISGSRGSPLVRIPLATEGYIFIFLAFIPAVLTGLLNWWFLFAFTFALCLFVVWFFRDPDRCVPEDPKVIVSPADGRVIKVERTREYRLLKDEALKISIFMNLFNVHVNRMPSEGRVLDILYNPGRFMAADRDKASLENEQNLMLIEALNGKRFVVCQIAGLIARRIVCRVKKGDIVKKGFRIGMIRFGSRLDVYLPADVSVTVAIGDKVNAGSSILAYWG